MKNWVSKKLGEVCELSAGGDVPKDNFSEIKTDNHQIPIYANGEKNEGFYGFTSKAKVTKPSITVSARGTIGYSVKRLEPFFPIVRLIVVAPINLNELGLDYLDYALRKIDFKHSGSSIPQLTVPMIRDYEIPIPSLPEQQRIVAILDEAFITIAKAKANAEQNLKNAKELFESYLQGVFEHKGEGWEEKTLGEVCEIDPKKSELKDFDENQLVSFLPMKDLGISQNQIIPIDTRKLKEVIGSYTYFRDRDILLAKVTPCFENGKLGIAEKLTNGLGFGSSEYIVFRPQNNVISEFIFYLLSSNEFRNEGKKLMFGTTGLKRLSKDYVRTFPFSLPSINEQQYIIQKLDSLSTETKRLEVIYKQKISDLDELKRSILQKAFSGELKTAKALVL